jgi:hypothetical protein
MDPTLKSSIYKQFGAAIDMLESALVSCPDELWHYRSQQEEFWYTGYHCLFWLDLYLSGAVEGFNPPAPFDLNEFDPVGLLPEHKPSKKELLGYVAYCREKCCKLIDSLTQERANRICKFRWGEISYFELLLYTMRHTQGHAAELLWILGEKTNSAPGWVIRAKAD